MVLLIWYLVLVSLVDSGFVLNLCLICVCCFGIELFVLYCVSGLGGVLVFVIWFRWFLGVSVYFLSWSA